MAITFLDGVAATGGSHYATLTVGSGFLKNLAALATDPQKGLTADDVEKAEARADALVEAWFARFYDVSDSRFADAPMVAQIAECIGSAVLLQYKFSRDGTGDVGLVSSLMKDARELAAEVSKTGLLDADHLLIPTTAHAVSRVGNLRGRRRGRGGLADLKVIWPMVPEV
jgi:hypothetical protein